MMKISEGGGGGQMSTSTIIRCCPLINVRNDVPVFWWYRPTQKKVNKRHALRTCPSPSTDATNCQFGCILHASASNSFHNSHLIHPSILTVVGSCWRLVRKTSHSSHFCLGFYGKLIDHMTFWNFCIFFISFSF